jgi:hypothetical protein
MGMHMACQVLQATAVHADQQVLAVLMVTLTGLGSAAVVGCRSPSAIMRGAAEAAAAWMTNSRGEMAAVAAGRMQLLLLAR